MGKTRIEYADRTWNPIVGCKYGCYYCYAEAMNKRFKWIEDWRSPQFFPERLAEPQRWRKPQKVFVGSISDVFGEWVPKSWIDPILQTARDLPRHTFYFLTKNPERYKECEFPSNCWLGTTVEHIDNSWRVDCLTKCGLNNIKFISFEPLLSDMSGIDLAGIDWIIIGGLT